jgi:hypothetical protein
VPKNLHGNPGMHVEGDQERGAGPPSVVDPDVADSRFAAPDNGPHLPLWDRLPALTFWFLPAAIGVPIIAHAVIHAKHARAQNRPPQPQQDTNSDTSPA